MVNFSQEAVRGVLDGVLCLGLDRPDVSMRTHFSRVVALF